MKKKIDITPNIETLFGTRDENLHVLEDGLNIGIDAPIPLNWREPRAMWLGPSKFFSITITCNAPALRLTMAI